jgi:hypothetical protein
MSIEGDEAHDQLRRELASLRDQLAAAEAKAATFTKANHELALKTVDLRVQISALMEENAGLKSRAKEAVRALGELKASLPPPPADKGERRGWGCLDPTHSVHYANEDCLPNDPAPGAESGRETK